MNTQVKKPTKAQLKVFVGTLYKLTDGRFKFSVYLNPDLKSYRVEMYFCMDFIASSNFTEFDNNSAFDCLIDLVNYAVHKKHDAYFKKFGIGFEIYMNQLNGSPRYSFRKNESSRWVNISQDLAKYILSQKDITVNGLCNNVVSYCLYDCYYTVKIKAEE